MMMRNKYEQANIGLPIRQIEQLRQCEIITENEVKTLCQKAREILAEESNVQKIDAPVTVSVSSFRHNVAAKPITIDLNQTI